MIYNYRKRGIILNIMNSTIKYLGIKEQAVKNVGIRDEKLICMYEDNYVGTIFIQKMGKQFKKNITAK